MNVVLLDTGCIVALLDKSESFHGQCVEVVDSLSAPLVTCEAVIAESCHLLSHLKHAAESVIENVVQGTFMIPLRLIDRALSVRKLLRKYASLPMDLADACLVDLAQQFRCGKILTLDRDFEVYRWDKNRPFENLVDLTR